MLKTKKVMIICIVLLVIEAAFFLIALQKKQDLLDNYIIGSKAADKNEYYLNDGLFYLNGDIDSCFLKIEKETFQMIIEDDNRFRELYEKDITNAYKPDNYWYLDFDEWYDEYNDFWSVARSYYLVSHTVLEPDTVVLAYDLNFRDNMQLGGYSSIFEYIDHNNVGYVSKSGEYLVFTNISE